VARILAGVSGGIAAYKACELVRLLVKDGHDVVPLVTSGAQRFVAEETFRALARRPPAEDVYLHLTRAELLVVAPCTANTLAKLAHGIADNVLAEAALAHRGPILVAPAMNPRMWSHPATQANVRTLVERGVELVGPDEGETAEGEWGVGRMAEPHEILLHIRTLIGVSNTVLQSRKVLVTAGGTREPLDSVRFVGNRSSGRMGVALAAEARRRGAQVTLVGANLQVPPPFGVRVAAVSTAEELERETLARADADVILMAAAVADYRPAAARADKRPKDAATWTVELEPTTDVLAELAHNRHDRQVIVGFAAEHGATGLARAREKLERKGADLFVFNDVARTDIGFDARENEVVIVSASAERKVEKARKEEIARVVLDEVEELITAMADRGAAEAEEAKEKMDRSTAKLDA
jgi:phosphopantothenoylcysteine decarboxylase / phosphopantothenate---cysteine ligase